MTTRVEILMSEVGVREAPIQRLCRERGERKERGWWSRRYTVLGLSLVCAAFALSGLSPENFPTVGLCRALCAVSGVAIAAGSWKTGA